MMKNSGGILNAPPIVTELQVVGKPTQTEIKIQYKVADADLQIVRHYLTVSGVYDKKEITKEVGYDIPGGIYTYNIAGLTRDTTYTIQITCDDGLIEGQSNAIQVATKSSIFYSFTINESDSNPATRVTYGDDAEGISPGTSNGLGGWADKWPFNKIRIVGFQKGRVVKEIKKANRKQYIDGTTVPASVDVMVEIPTIYWRKTASGGKIKFEISDNAIVGGDCYAHKVAGAIRSNVYVGSYLATYPGTDLRTASGFTPVANTDLDTLREKAQKLGNGYSLYNFNIHKMIQTLFTLVYKNTDSQTVLGSGYVSSSSKTLTGGTDAKGWVYGSTNSKDQICFLGIEDLWGNVRTRVDGVKVDTNRNLWICTDNKNFNRDGSGTGWENLGAVKLATSGGYFANINPNAKAGFCPQMSSGSSSTGYCDNHILIDTERWLTVGGYNNDGKLAGMYSANFELIPSVANALVGARVVYIGEVS